MDAVQLWMPGSSPASVAGRIAETETETEAERARYERSASAADDQYDVENALFDPEEFDATADLLRGEISELRHFLSELEKSQAKIPKPPDWSATSAGFTDSKGGAYPYETAGQPAVGA